nr:triple tyrosine motif-containing protein [Pleionea sp. CnH1-48]
MLSDNKVIISENETFISFEVVALNYFFAERQKYRYRLNGLHEDWIELDNHRTISFSSLKAGNYILNVQASDKDGRWLDNELNVDVVVESYFWTSGAAFGIYILLTSLVLFLSIYFWYLHIRKKHNVLQTKLDKSKVMQGQLDEQVSWLNANIEKNEQKNQTLETKLNELEIKLASYKKRDPITQFFSRKYFEELIINEERWCSRQNQDIPRGLLIGIHVVNYKQQFNSYYPANIEAAVCQLSEALSSYFSGDDLFCRWEDDQIYLLESGEIDRVAQRIVNLYKILSNRSYDMGNGKLLNLEFNIAMIPVPLVEKSSNRDTRIQGCYLMEDLLEYLAQAGQSGCFQFKCRSDIHISTLKQHLSDGVELLLEQQLFSLKEFETHVVEEED